MGVKVRVSGQWEGWVAVVRPHEGHQLAALHALRPASTAGHRGHDTLRRQGRRILHRTTRLDIAPKGVLDTLKVIQDASGLAYEVMGDEAALQRRFPQLNMRTGEEAMLTDGGALIYASTAMELLNDLLGELGVAVQRDTTVSAIDTTAKTVTTIHGQVGLGRIVAVHHRSSTPYQIHVQIRRLYF